MLNIDVGTGVGNRDEMALLLQLSSEDDSLVDDPVEEFESSEPLAGDEPLLFLMCRSSARRVSIRSHCSQRQFAYSQFFLWSWKIGNIVWMSSDWCIPFSTSERRGSCISGRNSTCLSHPSTVGLSKLSGSCRPSKGRYRLLRYLLCAKMVVLKGSSAFISTWNFLSCSLRRRIWVDMIERRCFTSLHWKLNLKLTDL